MSEIKKATTYLPDKVEALANKLLEKVPAEVFGEEGPEGPKMKDSWIGDERVQSLIRVYVNDPSSRCISFASLN
ncbi:vacuolar protein sorting-associated protein 62 [Artemisia annua]|uniref:Vacuolar protein sorting-associated protein 62 n=1 Tax=Artemisia annua TaxID=35608 RepID=A0A2U1PRX4_ARTAN|nr:vacuolar protein sorting-associated protein 62 [Artemisia annua]